MNANEFLTQRQLVDEAVARLEKKSSAEVVCVVATESGRYDRAESLAGLVAGCLGLAGAELAWEHFGAQGTWAGPVPLAWQIAGVVLGFALGVLAASYLHPLRRLLVPARELEDEVLRGAEAAFTRAGVSQTAGRTGVLVYVSLFEHRVVVLVDTGVRAVMPQDFARTLVDRAVAGLKAGRRAEVLAELVDVVGEALAPRLPVNATDVDELPNHVIALHPR